MGISLALGAVAATLVPEMPTFRRAAFGLFALTFFTSLLLSDRGMYSELVFSWLGPDSEHFAPITLLSGLFSAPPNQLIGVLWAGIVQWWMGSEVEAQWGSLRYALRTVFCALLGLGSLYFLAPLLPAEFSGQTVSGPLCVQVASVVFFAKTLNTIQFRPLGAPPISGAWLGILLCALLIAWPLVGGLSGLVGSVAVCVTALVAFLGSLRWDQNPGSKSKKKSSANLRVVRTAEDMLN